MKIQELRSKNEKELHDLLQETRHKLGKLKFNLTTKKVKNVCEARELRKTIAQILTILSEKHNVRENRKEN